MKLDLTEIVLHLGKRIRYEIDEPAIDDIESGLKCLEPITGEVVFSNTGSHIVLRGHFRTKLDVQCARCLSDYVMDVGLPIEEEFQIPGHTPEMIEEHDEEELPEEEKEPLFVDNILNLTELLRQDLVVAVPIKPLCDEHCKGLCPRCGQDLNQGQCDCPPEEVGEAFAALASLLEPEEGSEM